MLERESVGRLDSCFATVFDNDKLHRRQIYTNNYKHALPEMIIQVKHCVLTACVDRL